MPRSQQDDTPVQPKPTVAADAPRVSQHELVSESMSAKKKYRPGLLHASVVQPFNEVRDQLGKEMNDHWLDAMPVNTFLNKFVPATEEPLPELPDSPFVKVPTDRVESALYDPFVSSRITF